MISLMVLTLAGSIFCWGFVYKSNITVPEVIVQPVTRYVNNYTEKPRVEVIETLVEKKVIQEVPVFKYVEVEKEVPLELREFESEEELEEWIQADTTDGLPYIKDLFECENFSRTLMRHALEDGYHMSFQVLKNYTRPDTKEFIKGPHAINSTIIGNYIYFIDPQNDEVWIAYMMEQEPASE